MLGLVLMSEKNRFIIGEINYKGKQFDDLLIIPNTPEFTAGTTNASTFDIYNVTDSTTMLSSAISIASGAKSGTGTVDTDHDDVATGDIIRIDVNTLSTTKPKGLIVTLAFRLA